MCTFWVWLVINISHDGPVVMVRSLVPGHMSAPLRNGICSSSFIFAHQLENPLDVSTLRISCLMVTEGKFSILRVICVVTVTRRNEWLNLGHAQTPQFRPVQETYVKAIVNYPLVVTT